MKSSSFSRWYDKFETAKPEQVIYLINQFNAGKHPFVSALEEACYKEKYAQMMSEQPHESDQDSGHEK